MIKYYFPDSTIENPLKFFEFAYTKNGLHHLRREFLSNGFDIDEHGEPEFDLEKECIPNSYFDEETRNEIETEYWYKEYLSSKLFREKKNSLDLFSSRLDSCNSITEEEYVLKKFQRIIKRILNWVKNNSIPLNKGNLNFLNKLNDELEYVFKYRTGIITSSLDQTNTEKLKKIISDLVAEIDFTTPNNIDDVLTLLLAEKPEEFHFKIQVKCDNRQFQYVFEKFFSIGYPMSFGMNEIVKRKVFLRDTDNKPFTPSNIYNVSSQNKISAPKKVIEIDKIFSQF